MLCLTFSGLSGCGLSKPKYIDYAGNVGGTDGETPTATAVSYGVQMKTLIDATCAGATCHVGGTQFPDLSTYDGAKANGARSVIRVTTGTMPTTGALKKSDQDLFKAWADQGFPQ